MIFWYTTNHTIKHICDQVQSWMMDKLLSIQIIPKRMVKDDISNPPLINFYLLPLSPLRFIGYLVTYDTVIMMASSNGTIFRVTGHLCGEFTGHHKGQWHRALMFSLICVWMNDWVNNREFGDLRRYCTHYDVIVMIPKEYGISHVQRNCMVL